MLDFIVLGLIPGTNISIGFYVYLILMVGGTVLLTRSRILHRIHEHQAQKKADKINRLTL